VAVPSDSEITDGWSAVPNAYVPGYLVKGYDGYCPIMPVDAHINDDTCEARIDEELKSGKETLPTADLLINPGFLILQLGDIQYDHTLQMATEAISSDLQTLFAACDVPVTIERIRTKTELKLFMLQHGWNYSHIIFIGHGGPSGLMFLDDVSEVGAMELGALLGLQSRETPAQVISLCCYAGCRELGSQLSSFSGVSDVIAPDGTADLRWASVFVTGLLLKHLSDGLEIERAVRETNEFCTPLPMVLWRDGKCVSTGSAVDHPLACE